MTHDSELLAIALEEARIGYTEGGVPIGAALAIDGEVVATGRNRRIQMDSVIRHAEMDCLENAGRLSAAVYARSTLYTTLSPCHMCTGAILLYGIPRVVVGGSVDFERTRDLLDRSGVDVLIMENQECLDLIGQFIAEQPNVWNEDIGAVSPGDVAEILSNVVDEPGSGGGGLLGDGGLVLGQRRTPFL